ncbi:MAG: zinc metallopeptidase [Akkermansia sp.]|nr:zinc metallopeptidase [Akkermansia sp.]
MMSFLQVLAQWGPDASEVNDLSMRGFSSAMENPTTMLGIILLVVMGLLGTVVQKRLMSVMSKYSQVEAPVSGAETARRMLEQNGIHDVRVVSTKGKLTDHYNPADKTVNLSEVVYKCNTITAMAVAAHECGHAVQHATAYPWLRLRSSIVPMVNIGSRLGQVVFIAGLAMVGANGNTTVAWVGLALFACTSIFAFITLPVEFNASRRALKWLEESGLADGAMHDQAQTALKWAAMTYVSAALSSLAQLVYYAGIILSRAAKRR